MDFRDLLTQRASADFYRLGINGGFYKPSINFNGEVQSTSIFTSNPPEIQGTNYIPPTSPVTNSGPASIVQLITNAAKKHGIPFLLLEAIIWKESNFNPNAINKRSGAMGLGQLMPKTAAWLGVKNPMNPEENLDGAAKYIKMMLEQHKGDIRLALAAYNAGPGNVKKYGGIPPFKETRDYVKKITDRIRSNGGIQGYNL